MTAGMEIIGNRYFDLGKDKVVHQGKFLTTIERPFVDRRSGKKCVWEVIQRRTRSRTIVAVAPITSQGEVILTSVFRHPLGCRVIELCAGLMDGEQVISEVDLAKQEMRQELGYSAESFHLLMRGPFNAGMTDDQLAIYDAYPAVQVGEPELEPEEDIEVIRVPKHELHDFLQQPSADYLVDLKLWSLLAFM